jgi:hypothetical protein
VQGCLHPALTRREVVEPVGPVIRTAPRSDESGATDGRAQGARGGSELLFYVGGGEAADRVATPPSGVNPFATL